MDSKKRRSTLHRVLAKLYYGYADIALRMKDYVFESGNMKSKFYLPLIRTDMIQKTIFRFNNYFENSTLTYLCQEWNKGKIGQIIKEKAVLDIGANIGNHTLYFLNECHAKFVYCFEPSSDTFSMLKRNIEINHIEDRTILVNAGVGRTSGKGVISSSREGNTGFTQIEPSENGDIRIVAVDDMAIEDEIGLIKIDVEGFELEVLNGMLKTIEKNKPFVMIEIDNSNFSEAQSLFEKLGYSYVTLNKYQKNENYLFYVIE